MACTFGSPIAPTPYATPSYPSAYPSPAAYPSQAYPAAPKYAAQPKYEESYPDAPAKYNFAYEVSDAHTGDYKSQSEDRDGDYVKVRIPILASSKHLHSNLCQKIDAYHAPVSNFQHNEQSHFGCSAPVLGLSLSR